MQLIGALHEKKKISNIEQGMSMLKLYGGGKSSSFVIPCSIFL
jgi:hypothetical protein